ncbi:MAG: hypothetical protein JEZ00_02085 [Anaerolineaceae bacterium]|nr:hypothetical protein [Anaerolineaceae bacterium]
MKKELSIIKVLLTDYICFTAWLAPLVFLIAYIFTQGKIESTSGNLLYLTIGCTGVGFMLILWRIWLFRDVFENGQIVEGQIAKIFFYRSRGTVKFTYIFHDQQYTKSCVIQKFARNFSYQIGDRISVVLDPQNPKRAFVVEFYT